MKEMWNDGLLVFIVVVTVELLALDRNVHPETTFTADRAGALNDEANLLSWVGR